MPKSRLDRWSLAWVRRITTLTGLKPGFWALLTLAVVSMVLAARSSASGGIYFTHGLLLLMMALLQFERLGFIRLLEETRDHRPPAPSSGTDHSGASHERRSQKQAQP